MVQRRRKTGTIESEDGIWRYNGKIFENFTTKDGIGKIRFGICSKTEMAIFGLELETADYIATTEKHL